MRAQTLRFEYLLFLFAFTAVFFVVAFLVVPGAQAQNVPRAPSEEKIEASGIAFPVAELGGCRDKTECKRYCDDPAHLTECVVFAEKNGLMNKAEAERARKFGGALQERGGPGGCRTPKECEAFCENVANIETCLQFAEDEGVHGNDEDLQEARKIRDYLRRGGQMPGGCTSKESCEKYCGDFSHAKECFRFAKEAGFLDEGEGEHGPQNEEQFSKIQELMASGETPGGCKSKGECDRFCNNPDNADECIAFAEKAGFMKPEEVQMARQVMREGGPGGCRGERECRAYCNDPSHQEECFAFAEKHNLIRPEELKRAKEGFTQLKQGLEFAPPEVAQCLKARLGENIIADIQAGRLSPGPQIGERVRECFEKHGSGPDPREIFQRVPPEIASCAREKLGDDFEKLQNGDLQFTPQTGDVFRVCGEQARFQGGFQGGFGEDDGGGARGIEEMQRFLRSAPPEIATCLNSKTGGDVATFLQNQGGGFDPHEIIDECFRNFRPQGQGPGGGFPPQGGEGEFPHGPEGNLPEGVRPPFRPDPSQFRPENRATPFFGQDRGVPNPQDPILREQLKKELESRGFDPSQFNEAFSEPNFDPARFRETIREGDAERGFDTSRIEGDIRRQVEGQIRGQIEGQIRSVLPVGGQGFEGQSFGPGGLPPQGEFPQLPEGFHPPQGGEFRPPEGSFQGGFVPQGGFQAPSPGGEFGGFRPPEGGTFSPPPLPPDGGGGFPPPPPPPLPSDGGVQQGGNLLRAVRNAFFLLGSN